ncbi:MAG TPA: protein dehydratase, partial [Alcanivorax sp.]|nr:protein dehydratase [Alcanivorax sp.]
MKVVEAAQINEYVGEDMGASEWFTIDQGRINDFAAATLDH